MSIQLMEQGRPPYIVFEQRAEEDRAETVKQNKLVMKDVDYVILRTAGSKDTVEKVAPEWLDYCDREARKNPPKYPPPWAEAHRTAYERWKKGLEIAPTGYSVRQWAGISKAQAENLVMAGVLTVEDMAAANEQTMQKIGMGARALKEKAQAWIDSSKGNVGEELAALRAQISDLVQTVARQHEKNQELEAELQTLRPAKKRA